MIDEIVDVLRLFADWPTGSGPKQRHKLVGKTRPIRWMVMANRILRYLCIPLGAAAFLFLGDDTPWRFIAFAGGALLIATASFLGETMAIRRGWIRVQELPPRR